MMVKFINKVTGTVMYVPDAKMTEYLAAGHKPAADIFHERKDKQDTEQTKEPKRSKGRKKE